MERVMKTQMKEKVKNIATSEDAAKVVQEFEQSIKNKKSSIILLTYHQGQIFQKFKEKEQFVSMVSKFGVSKYSVSKYSKYSVSIVFKIALVKLVNSYSQTK